MMSGKAASLFLRLLLAIALLAAAPLAVRMTAGEGHGAAHAVASSPEQGHGCCPSEQACADQACAVACAQGCAFIGLTPVTSVVAAAPVPAVWDGRPMVLPIGIASGPATPPPRA
jgi:hypothetical protein